MIPASRRHWWVWVYAPTSVANGSGPWICFRRRRTAGAAPGPDHPQAHAVYLLAEMETAVTCGRAEAVDVREPLDSLGECNATSYNAYTEGLCLTVEAALLSGDASGVREFASLLAEHLAGASDRHLRRYAQWLINIVNQGDQRLCPLDVADDGQQTVFDCRARYLMQSLPARGDSRR